MSPQKKPATAGMAKSFECRLFRKCHCKKSLDVFYFILIIRIEQCRIQQVFQKIFKMEKDFGKQQKSSKIVHFCEIVISNKKPFEYRPALK
jgi:hypothetical protein